MSILVSFSAHAGVTSGLKFPNSHAEGTAPVRVEVQTPETLGGYTELLPFALRSPDQQEAGSCLYMSLTGIAEWWLARLNPGVARTSDGPLDLSERFMMNAADDAQIDDWKTDSIYVYNQAGGAMLNRDYRFTKGWSLRNGSGNVIAATPGSAGAVYDTNFNWVDERPGKAQLVPLPKFQRTVLFADPASNQWDTGVAPDDIADRIKTALRANKAPVQVIYNHYGYWHSTVILGYDDNADNNQCHFVTHFFDSMAQKAAQARSDAAREADPAKQTALLAQATKYEKARSGALDAYNRGGGCHKGAFYVRDSIYADPAGPNYEYDPSNPAADSHYVKSTVLLEYDWVHAMANHVVQITAQ